MELSRVNKLALLLVSILCVSLIIYVLILRQNSASNIDSLEQDIQYLTKKNEQLRGAYYGSSIEELQIKVRKQKDMIDDLMAGRCGEYYC
jgi:cell division protein FtsB